jgi:ribosomal subunit interface protein
MALKVSGKNVDIGQALRSRIESTISAAAGKYFDGGYSGRVTVTRSGRAFQTECAIHLDTGVVLEASGDSGDAHLSFGLAAERLEKQLRRYKRRLKQHKGRARLPVAARDAPLGRADAIQEDDATEQGDRHRCGGSGKAAAAVSQCGGTASGACGNTGGVLPQCEPWRAQHRLPSQRRTYRLDRPYADRKWPCLSPSNCHRGASPWT